MKQEEKVQDILDVVSKNGGQAYLVGGCVRDILLERTPNDYDITTNLLPEQVKKIFKEEKIPVITIGKSESHLTVIIIYKGMSIEATTFRKETNYSDGRHPDSVIPAKTIEEDLARRDFTINAIAMKSPTELVDPFEGVEDISRRVIRCVGSPKDRFNEDKLRAMRAIRFASQLGFKIDSSVFEELKQVSLEQISKERIQVEFVKILGSTWPVIGINLLKDTGLLKQFAPEMLDGVGKDGGRHHDEYIWDHGILALEACTKLTDDWRLRLTALLHDVGKPIVQFEDETGIHFNRHELVGSKIAGEIMKRLKFSNSDINYVARMIRHHMHTPNKAGIELSKRSIKNLVRGIGQENVMDMVILNYSDREGNLTSKRIPFRIFVDKYSIWSRWEEIRKEDAALKVTDLEVNGHDMMKLGYKGPAIGLILKKMLNKIDLDELKNNKKELMEAAKEDTLCNAEE